MNESTEYLLTSLTSKTVFLITQPSHAIESGVRVTVWLSRMMYSAPVCISACKKTKKKPVAVDRFRLPRGEPAFLRKNKKQTTTKILTNYNNCKNQLRSWWFSHFTQESMHRCERSPWHCLETPAPSHQRMFDSSEIISVGNFCQFDPTGEEKQRTIGWLNIFGDIIYW